MCVKINITATVENRTQIFPCQILISVIISTELLRISLSIMPLNFMYKLVAYAADNSRNEYSPNTTKYHLFV